MRSIGIAELTIVIAWLILLAIPIYVLHYLRKSCRFLSRICDDAAAIRRALEREAGP